MTETVLAPRAATPSTTAKTSTKVITDWTALIAGGFVTVLGEYKVRHSGWIDDVTEDGTIIGWSWPSAVAVGCSSVMTVTSSRSRFPMPGVEGRTVPGAAAR